MRSPSDYVSAFLKSALIFAPLAATAQTQPQVPGIDASSSFNNFSGGVVTGNKIYIGVTRAELEALRIEATKRSEEQRLLIAQLTKTLNIQEEQIKFFFTEVKASNIPPSQYGFQLVEYARRYNLIQSQLKSFVENHPELGPTIDKARAEIQSNRLKEAQETLRSALGQSSLAKSEAVNLIELQALTEGLRFERFREAALYLAAATLTATNSPRYVVLLTSYANSLTATGVESSRPDDLEQARIAFKDVRARVQTENPNASIEFDIGYAGCLITLWQFRREEEHLLEAESLLKGAVERSVKKTPDWIAATNAYSALAFLTGDAATALQGWESLAEITKTEQTQLSYPMLLSQMTAANGQLARQSSGKDKRSFISKSRSLAIKALAAASEEDAYTRGNIAKEAGISFYEYGVIFNDVRSIEDSVNYFDTAARLIPEATTYSRAEAFLDKGQALNELCVRERDAARCALAINPIDVALSLLKPTENNKRWFDAKMQLELAYRLQSELLGDKATLVKAADVAMGAAPYVMQDEDAGKLLEAYLRTARNNYTLAKKYGDPARARTSMIFYNAALELLPSFPPNDRDDEKEIRDRLSQINALLSQRTGRTGKNRGPSN